MGQYPALAAIERIWRERGYPPLLELTEEHRAHARDALRAAGLADGDWFVCLHAREGGFLREPDGSKHRHKNVDVLTYLPAIRAVTERGGWVIRVGDRSMRPLPPLERVVDYAHAPWKSPLLDVALAASCRFWLGTNSGLYIVAATFGVPVLLTNVAPVSIRPSGRHDMYVPKLYRWRDTGELVSFERAHATDLAHAADLDPRGVEVIDNTPSELADATLEMLDRLEGESPAPEIAALEDEFDALSPTFPHGTLSRVSGSFVVRHRDLVPGRTDPVAP